MADQNSIGETEPSGIGKASAFSTTGTQRGGRIPAAVERKVYRSFSTATFPYL